MLARTAFQSTTAHRTPFRGRPRRAPHDAAGAPALVGRAELGVVVDLGEERAELAARVALRQHAPRQVHLRRHDCARPAAAAVSLACMPEVPLQPSHARCASACSSCCLAPSPEHPAWSALSCPDTVAYAVGKGSQLMLPHSCCCTGRTHHRHVSVSTLCHGTALVGATHRSKLPVRMAPDTNASQHALAVHPACARRSSTEQSLHARTGKRLGRIRVLQPPVGVVHHAAWVVLHQGVVAPHGRVLRRLHRQPALHGACCPARQSASSVCWLVHATAALGRRVSKGRTSACTAPALRAGRPTAVQAVPYWQRQQAALNTACCACSTSQGSTASRDGSHRTTGAK